MDLASGKKWQAKAGDFFIVALALGLAFASMATISSTKKGGNYTTAVIEVAGREIKQVKLEKGMGRKKITVDGFRGPSVIEVEGQKVRMLKSACPDKLCVSMGWIESEGETIVCLPNRVAIKIVESPKGRRIDAVTE